MPCSFCKQTGHNVLTCKEKKHVDEKKINAPIGGLCESCDSYFEFYNHYGEEYGVCPYMETMVCKWCVLRTCAHCRHKFQAHRVNGHLQIIYCSNCLGSENECCDCGNMYIVGINDGFPGYCNYC